MKNAVLDNAAIITTRRPIISQGQDILERQAGQWTVTHTHGSKVIALLLVNHAC